MSASPGNTLILVENLSVPFDRRVWQEAEALKSAGWGVTVVCPRGERHDTSLFERLDGISIHRFRLTAASHGLRAYGREYGAALWRMSRIVARLLRERHYDVVHICNPPDLLCLPALLARARHSRIIYDQHDLVPELYLSRFKRGRDWGYYACVTAERMTYRLADVIVAPNESYRRVALRRGGRRPEDVFVVRSAPDLDRFSAVKPTPDLKRGAPHLLAYVGVMGPQDGVDLALRALSCLRTRRTDWHAIFVGSGDMLPRMRAMSTELGLDHLVEFTGRVPNDELLAVLSTADIGLSPDPKNPLNDVSTMNKIGEYMALGVPVVSFDLAEARVTAQDAAIYAKPNEPQAFADALDLLLSRREMRDEMARLGRVRMGGELAWGHSARSLVQAYHRAQSRGRRRGRSAPVGKASTRDHV